MELHIVANHKCKAYAVYCNPDHTHLFVGMHPSLPPSKLMEQVKSGSSKWLNEKKYIAGKFQWQDGYGAFSYSKSHIDAFVKYVLNQPKHHKNKHSEKNTCCFCGNMKSITMKNICLNTITKEEYRTNAPH